MRDLTWWALLLLLGASGGCASRPDAGELSGWRHESPPEWSLQEGSTVHQQGTLLSQRPAGGGDDLGAAPAAENYVRIALRRNPGLRAAELRVEELRERVPQARSLDDPMLEVVPLGAMAETAAGQVGWMGGVRQKLPFPGKLAARGRIAEQDVAMAVQELEATRLQVIRDTRRAFWAHYYATRAIEVIESDRELLSQLQRIAEARYTAGSVTQADVLRASVELSRLDNDVVTLHQRLTTAAAMLNSLMDRPITEPLPSPGPVPARAVSIELDRLLAQAAEANPDLHRIQEQLQRSREERRLARLQRWPDVTVGVNYASVDNMGIAPSANGTDQWSVGLGINLPIWKSKLDAMEREADRGLERGVAQLTAAQNRVAFEVQDAVVRIETQARQVELFRDDIIPQARQTVDASASAYRAGNLEFLTLVDNWRKLLDFELMLHMSQVELEQDLADLQQVIGLDLDPSQRASNE